MADSCRILTPFERGEMELQQDMAERGRRLRMSRRLKREVLWDGDTGRRISNLPDGIVDYLFGGDAA